MTNKKGIAVLFIFYKGCIAGRGHMIKYSGIS